MIGSPHLPQVTLSDMFRNPIVRCCPNRQRVAYQWCPFSPDKWEPLAIRWSHSRRIGTGCPAIMVATDGQVVTTHDEIADFTWPERARDGITEIDGPVYTAPLDVGEHSFERWHIAVYIGDDCDPHFITCGLPSCE